MKVIHIGHNIDVNGNFIIHATYFVQSCYIFEKIWVQSNAEGK